MRNVEVAWIFYELADLLEFKGEKFFVIRAYRNAARAIAGLDEPLEGIWKRKELAKIPGIGKNISAKIDELFTTGRIEKHEKLLLEIPPGLLDIMSLPGIGPKRGELIYNRLGVASLTELAGAARNGLVRKLPGMGSKFESEILRHIEMREKRGKRVSLATVRELALEIDRRFKQFPGAARIEAGGSLRRWRETVGDMDLVVASDDPEPVIEWVANYPGVSEVVEKSRTGAKMRTCRGVDIDLEVVPEGRFTSALFLSTGSRAHLKRLQAFGAVKKAGFDFIAAVKTGAFSSERDIYALLDLPYIPPELREDTGEVEAAAANKLPRLLETGAIKGDLHIHTNWSDGLSTIEQMVEKAREKGYQYIAVTDHSQSLKIARGLSPERLREQHRKIRSLNEKLEDFNVLTGIEVDILPNGELDCPDEILEETDVVIASVHTAFKQDRETMTARIISAVENKNVDIIGHLTGRLIGRREAYDLDVDKVLEAAAYCGTILEINSSPDRLDLSDINARKAREKGIKLAVNTDAHDLKRMEEMRYGVSVARRAWLEQDDVVNTMPLGELQNYLRRR